MTQDKKDSITLFSTHCPKCLVLDKKLKEKGITFNVITDTDTIIETGFRTVPLLKVGDKIMEFSEAIQWVKTYED